MEKQFSASARMLSFRRWSRQSFAVFSSLGRLIRIGVLSLSCSILALPGHSKETRDSLDLQQPDQVKDLDEVVVSAQMSPVLQSELMRVVQVISRAEIEQAPVRDVAGLLHRVRGVDIRSRGTFGMQADVGIRGGTFDQVMILLNGINVTDPQTGHHNLNLPVSIHDIERIEVLQGAGARHFGPNAFSGAINVITRNPRQNELSFSAEGGEYGFGAGTLAGAYAAGNWNNYLSVQGLRTDGFTRNTDFTSAGLYFRSLYKGEANELDMQIALSQKAFGANSFYTPRFPDQFEELQNGLFSLKLIPQGSIKIIPSVYWRRQSDRFELFRNEAPDWYNGHNYHLTDVAGGSINWNHPWIAGFTSITADYRFEHIYSNVLGNERQQPRSRYDEVAYTHYFRRSGLSIMAEHSVYYRDLSLSAGLLTWLAPELDKGIGFFPGMDMAWQINSELRWYASVSRTLRLPTFTDLFYSGPTNIGNAGLNPEKAVSLESGLKGSVGMLGWDLGAFRRWGKDMIDWVKSPGDEKWHSMNLTQVNFSGLEAGINFPLGTHLGRHFPPGQVQLNYAFLRADKQSGEFISNYVLDYLNHKVDLNLLLPGYRNWNMSWNVSYLDRAGAFMIYENNEFTRLTDFEPWWSVDARLQYRLGIAEFFAEVTNVLDTPTVSIANVPQPGRWGRLGIRVKFI